MMGLDVVDVRRYGHHVSPSAGTTNHFFLEHLASECAPLWQVIPRAPGFLLALATLFSGMHGTATRLH